MAATVRKRSIAVEPPEFRVGLKMKHTRLLKGLTLKQLADLAGSSESLLSRIENDNANPSIKTMHRVALALSTPVSGLFQENGDESNIVLRQGQRPTIGTDQSGRGRGHRLEALIPSGRGNLLSGYINEIEQGGGAKESSPMRVRSSATSSMANSNLPSASRKSSCALETASTFGRSGRAPTSTIERKWRAFFG